MSEIDNLSCPSCGGKLQVANEFYRLACMSCGSKYLARRYGGAVSLAPVVDDSTNVKDHVDKAQVELDIKRLKNEINDLQIFYATIQKKKEDTSPILGIMLLILGSLIIFAILAGWHPGLSLISILLMGIGAFQVYQANKARKLFDARMAVILNEAKNKKQDLQRTTDLLA